ncbi:hypothetical protein [Flavobacterium alkalisoli]|uniref:hypothetical protein n=1 Tax=Flavobacterium alkalisoli TaxID=2602769 RepID=UPI003A8E2263
MKLFFLHGEMGYILFYLLILVLLIAGASALLVRIFVNKAYRKWWLYLIIFY